MQTSKVVLREAATRVTCMVSLGPRGVLVRWNAARKSRSGVVLQCRAHGNLMLAQDGSGRALQGRPGFHISALGGDLCGFRLRQQAFVLDDEEAGGGSHFEFRLLGGERFLL